MTPLGARAASLAALLNAAALPAGAANEPPAPVGGSPDVTINGQPKARQGDGVAGDTSPNVLINGRPAAIQGSRTECGGVIVGGASNVFINGRPAATAGSATTPCLPR